MALSSAITWEVRTTGSDTQCGGGFKTGATGTDYSQQAAAQFSGTNLAVDAVTNTKVTSVTHNFVAADVGNVIQITAGAGWTTGFYEIVSVAANAATLDRSPAGVGTTGGTWWEGGALGSPGMAGFAASVTGMTIYIKNGTYTISSASSNVSGGCVNVGVFTRNVTFIGYGTTRTVENTDTKPVLQVGSSVTSAVFTSSDCLFVNLEFDGNTQTGSRFSSGSGRAWRCHFKNCTATNSLNVYVACSATGNSATPFGGGISALCFGCEAYVNTATGFNAFAVNCLSINNTGATTDGFGSSGAGYNCVAYGNGRHGFVAAINGLVNCHAEANSELGFSSNGVHEFLINCSGYNNTSGLITTNSMSQQINLIAITAGSVFTDAANNDFSLNNLVGCGRTLRAAGYPGVFQRGLTTGYLDIGAVQHQDLSKTFLLIP